MFRFIKYLNHLLSATNQHGVHSPFVYNYLTKCINNKKYYSKKKSVNILLKSITYFETTSLYLEKKDQALRSKILQKFPDITLNSTPFDMVFTDAAEQKTIEKLLVSVYEVHNDSVLILNNIYQNSTNQKNWEQLKNHDKATVTIDLFYCGVVFFRSEQAEEHFKIRI